MLLFTSHPSLNFPKAYIEHISGKFKTKTFDEHWETERMNNINLYPDQNHVRTGDLDKEKPGLPVSKELFNEIQDAAAKVRQMGRSSECIVSGTRSMVSPGGQVSLPSCDFAYNAESSSMQKKPSKKRAYDQESGFDGEHKLSHRHSPSE